MRIRGRAGVMLETACPARAGKAPPVFECSCLRIADALNLQLLTRLMKDWQAWLITSAGALACVGSAGGLAVSGLASAVTARKLLHVGTGACACTRLVCARMRAWPYLLVQSRAHLHALLAPVLSTALDALALRVCPSRSHAALPPGGPGHSAQCAHGQGLHGGLLAALQTLHSHLLTACPCSGRAGPQSCCEGRCRTAVCTWQPRCCSGARPRQAARPWRSCECPVLSLPGGSLQLLCA